MSNYSGPPSRSLMAVLFTDAVAFSRRASENEEQAHQLLREDFDIMGFLCAKHQGHVIKSTGDGLLMSFDSAAQAVDCALDIQRRFESRTRNHLQHRIGVHLCDVIIENGDVHGDGVNLASRLEQLASPGGICLSQTIYEIVRNRLPVQARSLGEQHLKNLAQPVTVYEISPTGAPRVHAVQPASTPIHLPTPVQAPLVMRPQPEVETNNRLLLWAVGAILFLGICILAGALFLGNRPSQPQVIRPPMPGEPGFVPPAGAPRPREPGFRPPRAGEPGFDPNRFPPGGPLRGQPPR